MNKILYNFCDNLYHNIVRLNSSLKLTSHLEFLEMVVTAKTPEKVSFTYKDEIIVTFQESDDLYYEDDPEGENAQNGLIISSEADWNTAMGFLYTQEREILAFVIALIINIIIERLLSKTKLEFIS